MPPGSKVMLAAAAGSRHAATASVTGTSPAAESQWLQPVPDFRLQPAPDREPPFDDEPAAGRRGLAGSRDQQLPFVVAEAAAPRFRPTGRVGEPEPRDHLPEPGRFARRFAIAVIEAATGRRTAGQLSSYTSPGVQAGLVRDAGRINRLGTATRPASLHSMHVAEPADGVVEAAAIVRVETRYRAIAFRLEGMNGRWRCVRLQIG
jgi:hypothetical protein